MTREEREKQWEKVEQSIDKLNDKSDMLRPDPKLDDLVREYDRLDRRSSRKDADHVARPNDATI
jgi:hypothetical protein